MTPKTLLALLASSAVPALPYDAYADETAEAPICESPKETEIGANAGYAMLNGEFGNTDGAQVRIGGNTSLYTFGNGQLVLDSSFITDYFGYEGNGVQKDSLTDAYALVMYNGFEGYSVGGGINLFFFDGSGMYASGQPMELTDYAIGPSLRGTIIADPVKLVLDYSLGFGQLGSNRADLDFLLKNRLGINLGIGYEGFSADVYTDLIFNYMPYSEDSSFELKYGLRVGYGFIDFMAANAFYEHAEFYGIEARDSADAVGGGFSLFF
ncbi:MAG TPA: hypothetical protein HA362_04335 [Nanoarchaeota archaeon]|nr:hypothetical protein [Nanoarchaeota archaeon]